MLIGREAPGTMLNAKDAFKLGDIMGTARDVMRRRCRNRPIQLSSQLVMMISG